MTPAQAESVNGRLGHELLTAYLDRVRFEAQLVGGAMWGQGSKKKEAAVVEGGSDADLMSLGVDIGN